MSGDSSRRILVFGAGGGGDIVTAAAYAVKLRRYGYTTFISAAPWERMVIDPLPGPIHLGEIRNTVGSGNYYVVVDGSSYAVREGRKIVFQAANVSKALSEEIYLCDMNLGVEGVYRSLAELTKYLDIDLVVGLDVGGDILALGYEDELWSPLADQISLSSLYKLTSLKGVETEIALASPGADGELDRDYVMKRINDVASEGGLRGSIGFGSGDIEVIKRITDHAVTEAGRVILDALSGFHGRKKIRNGTRSVYIDVLSTLVFLLDTGIVYSQSDMARKIFDTSSLEEANDILIGMGIATEYELEREVYRMLRSGEELSRNVILRARENILRMINVNRRNI